MQCGSSRDFLEKKAAKKQSICIQRRRAGLHIQSQQQRRKKEISRKQGKTAVAHNTLKKEGRMEPGGLASTQKRMLRDKRYEVTLNHEGEQVETTDRWKGYQTKSKPRLLRCNTFLASLKLCQTVFF